MKQTTRHLRRPIEGVVVALAVIVALLASPASVGATEKYPDGTSYELGDMVSYDDGSPAARVKVDLFEASSRWNRGAFLGHTRTDSDGRYLFEVSRACYILVFIAPLGTSFGSADSGRVYDQRYACVDGASRYDVDAVLYRSKDGGTTTTTAPPKPPTTAPPTTAPPTTAPPTTAPPTTAPPTTAPPTTAPPPPRCAAVVGTNAINEGSQASYYLRLTAPAPHDMQFHVQAVSGSAKVIGAQPGVQHQDIIWGGYYRIFNLWGHPISTHWWRVPNSTNPAYGDRPMYGSPYNTWDFSLFQNGALVNSSIITVTVPKGSVNSYYFNVQAWRETVTIDQMTNASGYREGSETFELVGTGGCKLGIWIHDTSTYHFVSPIGLDLDGSGSVERISGEFDFDFDGDGVNEAVTEWFAPTEGILFDSRIDGPMSGEHLFGDQGGLFADGYEKLARLDADGDGRVAGAELDGLALWVDADSDARFDAGEQRSLADEGVIALSTSHLGFVSSAELADGSTMVTEDLWFPAATGGSQAGAAVPARTLTGSAVAGALALALVGYAHLEARRRRDGLDGELVELLEHESPRRGTPASR